jgi:Topoisomerase DNA binding C4 zinc finger
MAALEIHHILFLICIALTILSVAFYWGVYLIRRFLIKGKVKEKKSHKKPCSCGGWLVEKTAHKGFHYGQKFLGCTNYPKCHRMEAI